MVVLLENSLGERGNRSLVGHVELLGLHLTSSGGDASVTTRAHVLAFLNELSRGGAATLKVARGDNYMDIGKRRPDTSRDAPRISHVQLLGNLKADALIRARNHCNLLLGHHLLHAGRRSEK